MTKQVLDYTVKELFGLTRRLKMIAITMLIDSIADDKGFEVKASIETEVEYSNHDKAQATYEAIQARKQAEVQLAKETAKHTLEVAKLRTSDATGYVVGNIRKCERRMR